MPTDTIHATATIEGAAGVAQAGDLSNTAAIEPITDEEILALLMAIAG